MLSVQPASLDSADKELSAIGIPSRISHRQHTRTSVLKVEVLIVELSTIDTVTTPTISALEITTLDHKVRNHPVELGPLVTVALLASSESTEVLGCPGNIVAVETESDSTDIFVVVRNIEVDFMGYYWVGGGGRGEGEEDGKCRNEERCEGEDGLHLGEVTIEDGVVEDGRGERITSHARLVRWHDRARLQSKLWWLGVWNQRQTVTRPLREFFQPR